MNRSGDIFWSVEPDDKAVFDAWCQRHGTTRNFAGGNLLRWFNAQDDVLKEHIAKLITDRQDVRDLLVAALKKRPRRRRK